MTTKRSKHTVAPSAAFLAVFVSTHFLGMLGILGLLWAVFTLLGWNELGTLLSERMTAIYSYVIMYVIVKIFLTKIVLNKWLSEKGSAKLPRILSNFTLSLSVYYVFTGVHPSAILLYLYLRFPPRHLHSVARCSVAVTTGHRSGVVSRAAACSHTVW